MGKAERAVRGQPSFSAPGNVSGPTLPRDRQFRGQVFCLAREERKEGTDCAVKGECTPRYPFRPTGAWQSKLSLRLGAASSDSSSLHSKTQLFEVKGSVEG